MRFSTLSILAATVVLFSRHVQIQKKTMAQCNSFKILRLNFFNKTWIMILKSRPVTLSLWP